MPTQEAEAPTFNSQSRVIPNDNPTTLTPPAGAVLDATAWDFDVQHQKVGDACSKIPLLEDGTLVLDMATIDCPGFRRHGTLIEVRSGAAHTFFVMNDRVAPQVGDDIGIALTLVNSWKEKDADNAPVRHGARLNNGTSFYYSVSNLKTNRFRLIGNVSLLDGDPKIDFEVGLGVGVLFRVLPLTSTGTGLGLAGGVGYNLMLDDRDQRWYSFFGFSMNFNQQTRAAE